MEFGEKYRSGREKHLKRPKIRLVLLLLRVKAPFPPPKPPKSPNFTKFHQNGWNLAKLCGIQWISPFWREKLPNGPRTMQKGIRFTVVFSLGHEWLLSGGFYAKFTVFHENHEFHMFSWNSTISADFACGSGTSVCGAKRHINSCSFLGVPDYTFAGNSWIPWFPRFFT